MTAQTCTCRGEGWLADMITVRGKPLPLGRKPCPCNAGELARMNPSATASTDQQLESVWPGLSRFDPAPSTNLAGKTRTSIVVRATIEQLRAHVARMVLDSADVIRGIDVITDEELLAIQFSGADREAAMHAAISTPSLMVIILGIRQTDHGFMPQVLMQAVNVRRAAGQTTWLVRDPDLKIKKVPCWSEQLDGILGRWEEIIPGPAGSSPAGKVEAAAARLEVAVKAAGGRLPAAEAHTIADLPKRSYARACALAGLETQQIPPGKGQYFLVVAQDEDLGDDLEE